MPGGSSMPAYMLSCWLRGYLLVNCIESGAEPNSAWPYARDHGLKDQSEMPCLPCNNKLGLVLCVLGSEPAIGLHSACLHISTVNRYSEQTMLMKGGCRLTFVNELIPPKRILELKPGCRQMGVLQVPDTGVAEPTAISLITGVWKVIYDRGCHLL